MNRDEIDEEWKEDSQQNPRKSQKQKREHVMQIIRLDSTWNNSLINAI